MLFLDNTAIFVKLTLHLNKSFVDYRCVASVNSNPTQRINRQIGAFGSSAGFDIIIQIDSRHENIRMRSVNNVNKFALNIKPIQPFLQAETRL